MVFKPSLKKEDILLILGSDIDPLADRSCYYLHLQHLQLPTWPLMEPAGFMAITSCECQEMEKDGLWVVGEGGSVMLCGGRGRPLLDGGS